MCEMPAIIIAVSYFYATVLGPLNEKFSFAEDKKQGLVLKLHQPKPAR